MAPKGYEVGFGKPPKHTRFQKGVCPNRKGRGAKKDIWEKEVFRKILDEQVPYTAKGKQKSGTRLELLIRQRVGLALKGDVKSAVSLLNLSEQLSGAVSDDVDIVTFTGGGLAPTKTYVKISDR